MGGEEDGKRTDGAMVSLTNQHQAIEARLEQALKAESNLSLNEYYVLYYLEKTPIIAPQ